MWSEWKNIGVVLPLKPTGTKMTPLISLAPPEGANRTQLAKFLEMAIGETVLVKKLCESKMGGLQEPGRKPMSELKPEIKYAKRGRFEPNV
uniref:Uncharacterized protein n=1 Tax=Caenorhabditis japonica TaxID=281687 RepID=A0A8R1IY53_CAEJA